MRTGRWRSFSCESCSVTLQVEAIGANWIWPLGDQESQVYFASIPPPLTFYGTFATTITLLSPAGATVVYVERCGTHLHMQLATGYSSEPGGVIGNPRVVAFYALDQGRATGVFLPSLRRLSFSLPVRSCSFSCAAQLDARRLYFTDGRGHGRAAAFPFGPARSPKH
jgi:hypothetical protein